MTVTTFTIYGFQGCKYFNGAIELMKTLVIKNPKKIKVIVSKFLTLTGLFYLIKYIKHIKLQKNTLHLH